MKETKTKERKLSEAELKRKAEFEKLTEELVAKGYKPNHITMSVLEGNVYALVAAMPFIAVLMIVYLAVGNKFSLNDAEFYIAFGIFMVLIVVHELIHGITWSIFVEDGWKAISFGFIAEYLTPYCSCNQPMRKHQIIAGALMPTIILGFIPGIVAIIIESSILLAVAMLMVLGGGADLLIVFKLLRYKSPVEDVVFIDHPYELGTAVFEKM